MEVFTANTEAEIKECFAAFKELRPHLTEKIFIAQVLRQMKNHNYAIAYIKKDNRVVSASGYRISEYLAWGKILYVDDLITVSSSRSTGYGGMLMDWLIVKAKDQSCQEFHLDSGTHRHDAHRFYFSKNININSFHFSNKVERLNA